MPQMFVLTVLGAIAAPRAAILVSNHANMHKHTLAEAHSPGDGDHLLHYLSVEGDNHPQFLCDKEHNKNTINKGTLGGARPGLVIGLHPGLSRALTCPLS